MRPSAVRPSSWLILVAVALIGMLAMTGQVGGPVERALESIRFGLGSHPASGQTVIVEMDGESAGRIKRWPWPRRNYAVVIDRLREAGAASIVFDVDFSATSEPKDDAILADALARSNGLVALPTFSQVASNRDRRRLDAIPLARFREHVALASVVIRPDVDGLIRTMPLATVTDGTPRPSLSAYIAARQGRVDQSFPIDFSIDPASIPRLSFVAVQNGQFDPKMVRGRDVLIGATAVEMGDRYAASHRGVLPGVTIQALAAETLRRGVPQYGSGLTIFVIALFLALPVIRAWRGRMALAWTGGGAALLSAGVIGLQHLLEIFYPLGLGLVMLSAALALCAIRLISARFSEERMSDAATGLPNERAFLAQPDQFSPLAVIQINNLDALASVIGADATAQSVVRISERLRLLSVDGRVYRVRAHQLALDLPIDCPSEDLAATMRAVLLEPVEVAGRKVDIACTVGLCDDGLRAPRLTAAILAAEEAIKSGAFWRQATSDHEGLERSVSLMGELDAAIMAGQLSVHYQPKLHLQSGRVTSAEALVRWHHPKRGFIRPDLFIPLAEQSDRIAPLTLHVLEMVIRDVQRWRADGNPISIAINISAKLLSADSFNAEVDRLLIASAVSPEALIFEVTESATMTDPTAAIAALRAYRKRGIAVSMDDYGTGQSTLTYLRQLPLSELKIDRSFVQHAHLRPSDAVLVKSTIDLGHQLGLKIVAEGVEEKATMNLLRDLGCDFIQGYLISKPLPSEDFENQFFHLDERRCQMNVAAPSAA